MWAVKAVVFLLSDPPPGGHHPPSKVGVPPSEIRDPPSVTGQMIGCKEFSEVAQLLGVFF